MIHALPERRNRLSKSCLLCIAGCLSWLIARAEPGVDPSILVIGFGSAEYFTTLKQIPFERSWVPGSEPLPWRLGLESRLAERSLSERDHLTNHLDFDQATIRRFVTPENRADANHEGTGLSANQWFVALRFLVQPWGEVKHVVMLMDGTHATEKLRPVPTLDFQSKTSQWSIVERPLAAPVQHHGDNSKLPNEANAYEIITSPNFVIPAVQWNPSIQEFPLDLSAQAIVGRKHVAMQKAVNEESLSLEEIFLENYMPRESITANNLSFSANRHHWLVLFRYRVKGEDEHLGYNVYMLLDGSILLTSEDVQAR